MAHNLDITAGVASFADSRDDAWHRLGQRVGHTMTAAEALDAAHLAGWNVRKMPIVVPQPPILTPDGVTTPAPLAVPDQYATVRTNPITGHTDVLGVVGAKYEPVQNEALTGLLDAITDESGAHYQTAGALRGGREVFVTMKLPHTMTLAGHDGSTDTTVYYLVAMNSHDGGSRLRIIVSPVRVVCQNTQTAALARAVSSYAITHTGGARIALAEIRTALKLSWTYMQAFEAEVAALYAAEMDPPRMRRFAAELLGADTVPSPAAATRRRDQADTLTALFTDSPTIAASLGHTRWAAYNAVSEYCDHIATPRGTRSATEAADTRALRAITPGSTAQQLKTRAFAILAAL